MDTHRHGSVTQVQHSTIERMTLSQFVFKGVYTKNRAFRLYRSSKFNRTECFVVASENQWKPSIERDSRRSADQIERETFLASLVYFNGFEFVFFFEF